MKRITEKQKAILLYTHKRILEDGQPPLQKEVAKHFDITARCVCAHYKFLEKKKFIFVNYRRQRGVTINQEKLGECIDGYS